MCFYVRRGILLEKRLGGFLNGRRRRPVLHPEGGTRPRNVFEKIHYPGNVRRGIEKFTRFLSPERHGFGVLQNHVSNPLVSSYVF